MPEMSPLPSVSCVIGRRGEAAQRLIDQPGEGERRAVLVFRADDLHADWQAVRHSDGNDGRRQAAGRGGVGPDELIQVPESLAVDIDSPVVLALALIVRKGGSRTHRANYHVEMPEEVAPLLPQPLASEVGLYPIPVAH